MLVCNSECGTEACTFRTINTTSFLRHVNIEARETYNKRRRLKVRCPYCNKELNRDYLPKHIRRKHGVNTRRNLRCPPEFDKHAFAFVKKLVYANIQHDVQSERDGKVNVHEIAIAVYNRLQGLHRVDDNGGNCSGPCAIVLYPHSLFSLTLDRIDDSKPHFWKNSLENLCFTIRGMNTHTSLGKGSDTCARLRTEMRRVVPEEEVFAALKREQMSKSMHVARSFGLSTAYCHNTLYLSARHAFSRDTKCKKAFRSVKHMFQYCYTLYANANARCAISGIFLSGHAYNRVRVGGKHMPHPFAPSVDAIIPHIGHVHGNIRIICCFLNATDTSKVAHRRKQSHAHGVIQHAWTKELWNHYVGCANES